MGGPGSASWQAASLAPQRSSRHPETAWAAATGPLNAVRDTESQYNNPRVPANARSNGKVGV